MVINFTKMHGLGNDFMIIDGVRQQFQPTPQLIRQWADRRTGVGFDQLLLVESPHDSYSDFFYRIFNADGNEVAQCGNGARCLARFLQDEKLTNKNNIIVETNAGTLELKLENDGQITVNMGAPNFEPTRIPLLVDQKQILYSLVLDKQTIKFSALSLGNPHCIIQVEDLTHAPVRELGSLLMKHPYFPEGVNVGFMQIINPEQIRLRVYERGTGETLACGSGACAAVIAGRIQKLLKERVAVEQPGGQSTVLWEKNDAPVFLTGPAVKVFQGNIAL